MSFEDLVLEPEIKKNIEDFLRNCPRCKSEGDQSLLKKAFETAYNTHKGANRKNGDPFIVHPLEVARIVTNEIGLGLHSAISALLHHVHETTDFSFDDIGAVFGTKVSQILLALSKVPEDSYNTLSLQAETFRTLLLTLSDDMRVVFIKLADRLHNMRTIGVLSDETRQNLANETMELYAPLAHRIGLYSIKTELEDLCFKTLHPAYYAELQRKVQISEKKRMHLINRFAIKVSAELDKIGVKHEITGRTKSIHSIAQKIDKKHVPFEEIYDILAIRIVFEPQQDRSEAIQCWEIYTKISQLFDTMPDRMRDWVSKPKDSGYEALHVTVKAPGGDWVEVQIRSQRMHEIAEKGVAAHWKYKGVKSVESQIDNWIGKARDVLESTETNALEKLDQFKMTLFSPEILVFTPKDDVVHLPHGATVLDFAFAIHSELGFQCIGAQIGKKIYPADHVLQGGDKIKIITSQKAKPKPEWLEFLITTKARGFLRNYFKESQNKQKKKGKSILQEAFDKLDLNPTSEILRKLFDKFNVKSKNQLYDAISQDKVSQEEIIEVLKKCKKSSVSDFFLRPLTRTFSSTPKKSQSKIYEGDEEPFYEPAPCCNPIPGDEIIGYKSNNNSVVLHKSSCSRTIELANIFGDKIINAIWTTHKIVSFLTIIKISGADRIGIIHEVTGLLSVEMQVDIKGFSIEAKDGLFTGIIKLFIHNVDDLNDIIRRLQKVDGIKTIERMENIEDL